MSHTAKNGCNCEDPLQQKECLADIINTYKDKEGALIPVLHQTQALYGYLPDEVIRQISDGLKIPYSEVNGVISFYHFFSTTQKGKYEVMVCMGTACYVRGANKVLEKFEEELDILVSQTTDDLEFTLSAVRCFGACGLAPAVSINGTVHQKVKPSEVAGIVEEYKNKPESEGDDVSSETSDTDNALSGIPAIKQPSDLLNLKGMFEEEINVRLNHIHPDSDGNYAAGAKRHVMVCSGSGCSSCGCGLVRDAFLAKINAAGISDKINIFETGCIGCCTVGTIVSVYPEGVFYQFVNDKDVEDIVESHLKNGKPVERLLRPGKDSKAKRIPLLKDIEYFAAQRKNVLKHCGVIDPSSIKDCLAVGGYQSVSKVLTSMNPEEVCDEVTKSGLRGRGGAGFPTGMKWKFAKNAPNSPKYVICNADEGDPGAFMDRSILESDPHIVLEGMLVCGFAIGSKQGFIYVRAEYALAIKRLETALSQARLLGLLGDNILGTGFKFDIEIRIGAGAFVCGEETALMNSIEGQRGEPRPRPPFPAISGLWKSPTNINNVETFANIAKIIMEGGENYAAVGTDKSKGTKVFALTGDVVNSGLCEVPMGATLKEIVFDIGGGIIDGKKFKAAQLGGPSGGCIPVKYQDIKIDYESLLEVGAMMGSGGLVVMDEDTCMVDMARFFMDFVQDESCGKCTPCRVGSKRMLEILTKITEGGGSEKDIEALRELGVGLREASLCGLGQTAPNPVLSTLMHFGDEYLAHCKDKACPAGVCKPLFHFAIEEETCTGCTLCAIKCPVKCIDGERKGMHTINQTDCTKCGLCYDICKFKAVKKIPGAAKAKGIITV